MRSPIYDKALVGISASIPLEYKQILQIIGGGVISNGIRQLIERMAPEEIEELKVKQDEMQEQVQKSQALREKVARSSVATIAPLSKERGRVPGKKKRKRPVSR